MSFDDNLRLALDPSEQLPRELHLGEWVYSWTRGKLKRRGEQPGFRQLTEDELRQIMRRLQAAPPDHVVFLNLWGHTFGDDNDMMMAHIAALRALRVLILWSTNYESHFLSKFLL